MRIYIEKEDGRIVFTSDEPLPIEKMGDPIRVPAMEVDDPITRKILIEQLCQDAAKHLDASSYCEIRMKAFGNYWTDGGTRYIIDSDPDHRGIVWMGCENMPEKETPNEPVWIEHAGYWLLWAGHV
jgi:hypothetical protein